MDVSMKRTLCRQAKGGINGRGEGPSASCAAVRRFVRRGRRRIAYGVTNAYGRALMSPSTPRATRGGPEEASLSFILFYSFWVQGTE
jgi:hypothetical protein